jgi:hypothetical protein
MKPTMAILVMALMKMLLSASSNVVAQERSVNQTGCAVVDKSRPAQFVSYESASETTSVLTLRLHNNTTCSIIVETDDTSPMQLRRLPTGGVKVEPVTTSRDGVRLPLHYLLQDRQRWRAPEPAYGWGDSVYTYELLAGQSAVFSVSKSHFRNRLDVAVPFNYAWEGDKAIGMGVGGVVHRVYFLFDDVPEAVLRDRRPTEQRKR